VSSSVGRREAVLRALRQAPGGVSGQDLASELGVSRAAVAKHVAALRDLGYAIDAEPGRGYRLTFVPDTPLPYEVAALLASRFWGPLAGGRITGSTNDDARALARAGAGEGTVVLAAAQTGGRGRLGRSWESPEGGVYLSAVLRPDFAPADAGPLPLVIGLGVALGLEGLGARVGLKWPNDVFVLDADGRPEGKVAGVLLESMTEGERLVWVVAGVGVDVRSPREPAAGAAYLEHLPGGPPRLARVAAAVLDGIADAYARFVADGFAPMAPDYASRSVLAGRDVAVSDAGGRHVAQGVVAGVDESGRLLLDGPSGRTAVSAGDVTLRA